MSDTDGRDCGCKVGRVAASRGLEDLDAELETRWLGRGRERASLRDLAGYVNRRVLRDAMREAGMEVLDGEVENTYRLLTDDEVSSGMRTQARSRLERASVDVDRLEADFVSHQTVHTHLTDCLEVSHDGGDDRDPREKERRRIRAVQNRTATVAEDGLARLARNDDLAVDEFDVFVEVSVLCGSCGRTYELGALLEQGGCDCQRAD